MLYDEENNLVESKEKIMKTAETFYTELYDSNRVDSNQIKANLNHIKSKLTPEENETLSKAITEEEIKTAIKQMSPGDDGLPKEFYNVFQKYLVSELSELYNNTLLFGKQPQSKEKCPLKTYL